MAGPAAGEAVDCIVIGTGTELDLAVKAGSTVQSATQTQAQPCKSNPGSTVQVKPGVAHLRTPRLVLALET